MLGAVLWAPIASYPPLNSHLHMYQFIVDNQHNLMFIHFDSIDDAGHAHQWGTQEYYDAVKVYVCWS